MSQSRYRACRLLTSHIPHLANSRSSVAPDVPEKVASENAVLLIPPVQAEANRRDGGLGSIGDIELVVDRSQVVLDGLL